MVLDSMWKHTDWFYDNDCIRGFNSNILIRYFININLQPGDSANHFNISILMTKILGWDVLNYIYIILYRYYTDMHKMMFLWKCGFNIVQLFRLGVGWKCRMCFINFYQITLHTKTGKHTKKMAKYFIGYVLEPF